MKHNKKKNTGKGIDSFIESHNRRLTTHVYQEKNTDTKPQTDIREGQEIKVRIKAIGAKGDGIGKYKEFTVIVANTKVNDDVDVIVEKITSTNLVFARIK